MIPRCKFFATFDWMHETQIMVVCVYLIYVPRNGFVVVSVAYTQGTHL